MGDYIHMFRMTWEWRMSSWKPWRPYRPQRKGRRSTQSEKTNLLHESKHAKHTNNTGSPAPQNIKIKLSNKTLAGSGPYPHLHPNQVSSGVEMNHFASIFFCHNFWKYTILFNILFCRFGSHNCCSITSSFLYISLKYSFPGDGFTALSLVNSGGFQTNAADFLFQPDVVKDR